MPTFNKRNINRRSIEIFKRTGRVMAMYVRNTAYVPPTGPRGVPSDMYAKQANPIESSTTYTKVYFFGKFEKFTTEEQKTEGRVGYVQGVVTVPAIYSSLLKNAAYIDPYNDGSRYEKLDADEDEEGLYIYQTVKSVVDVGLGEADI